MDISVHDFYGCLESFTNICNGRISSSFALRSTAGTLVRSGGALKRENLNTEILFS